MKLSELVEHCSFHDDTLKDIRYNPETKTAEFEIVFSNYEMESFTGRKEEILIIKLVFTDVSFLDCSHYVKRTDYEDYVFSTDLIHNKKIEEGLSFYMLNEIYVPDGYYIRVFAQDVEFIVLGVDEE